MPDLQTAEPPGLSLAAIDAASRGLDDSDYALGCECADPRLQIERWSDTFAAVTDCG